MAIKRGQNKAVNLSGGSPDFDAMVFGLRPVTTVVILSMKISILNLLCFMTITGLSLALITCWREDRVVTVNSTDSGFSFDTRESIVGRTPKWIDKNSAPPVTLSRVFEIANEIKTKLSDSTEQMNIGGCMLLR